MLPDHIAQSVAHLTQDPEVPGSIPGPHAFISPSADSRRAVISYWQKYVHIVLVNRLGGLSLPRKSVVRLTDCPDMTIDVYQGRKTTTEQRSRNVLCCFILISNFSQSGGGKHCLLIIIMIKILGIRN